MAYNNYFPYGYQSPYQIPAQSQPQQNNNGIIWVVGEGGADSYLVAPGQTVLLWDSTAPVIYMKTADSMGRPSKRILDYKERGIVAQESLSSSESEFAKQSDVDFLKGEIEDLRAMFKSEEKGAKK